MGGNGQLIHILERWSCTKSWEKNAFYSTTREGTTETTWYYGDYISSHMISCHPQWSRWNKFSMCFEICHGAAIATYQKFFSIVFVQPLIRVLRRLRNFSWHPYQPISGSVRTMKKIWHEKKMFIQVIPSYYSFEKCSKGIPNWTGWPVIEK